MRISNFWDSPTIITYLWSNTWKFLLQQNIDFSFCCCCCFLFVFSWELSSSWLENKNLCTVRVDVFLFSTLTQFMSDFSSSFSCQFICVLPRTVVRLFLFMLPISLCKFITCTFPIANKRMGTSIPPLQSNSSPSVRKSPAEEKTNLLVSASFIH